MNDLILFSFFTAALIVSAVLYFSYVILPKKSNIAGQYTKTQQYFRDNQQILHPNVISSWRKKYGWICAILLGFSLYYNIIILQCVLINIIAFLAVTDSLDGQAARCCGLETPEGKIYDAECDKYFDLPILGVLSYLISPYFLIFVGILTLCDIIGQTQRSNNTNPAAGKIGKIKTAIKFISIFIFYSFNSAQILHIDYVIYSLVFISILCILFAFWSMILKFDFAN
jgi:phosphatidylglycerophosphate synthase